MFFLAASGGPTIRPTSFPFAAVATHRLSGWRVNGPTGSGTVRSSRARPLDACDLPVVSRGLRGALRPAALSQTCSWNHAAGERQAVALLVPGATSSSVRLFVSTAVSKLLVMLAVVGLLVGAIAPARAMSQASQVLAHGPGSHGEPGGIAVVGSPGDNQIEIRSPGPDTIVVFVLAGAVPVRECHLQFEFSSWGPDACGCESVDSMNASCNTPYGMDVYAELGDGDDIVSLFDPMILRATGGAGADRLSANTQDDFLRGGMGPDRLSGRQGNDRLYTRQGQDSVFGGAGNDFLWALDRDRDHIIDCGAGNDRAFIDRNLDPEPLHCEYVRFGPIDG